MELASADGRDAFLPLLLNLAGFRPDDEANNVDGICDETIALYAGVLQQRPVSPLILTRMLASYFEVPVHIEESSGSWSALEAHEQCSLGGTNATVGENTLLGQRSWRPDLGATLSIGPLARAQFERFLPGAGSAVALKKLLGLFGEQTVTYQVRLILKAQDVRQLCLAGGIDLGSRLGQDSFLASEASTRERSDMRYHIVPLAPLPALAARHRIEHTELQQNRP